MGPQIRENLIRLPVRGGIEAPGFSATRLLQVTTSGDMTLEYYLGATALLEGLPPTSSLLRKLVANNQACAILAACATTTGSSPAIVGCTSARDRTSCH